MRLSYTTAVAASILSSAGLVAAAPRLNAPVEIAVLGGSTFRLHQKANPHFRAIGRGPRAIAKAYQKFGVAVPDSLLEVLLEILQQLGITIPNLEGGQGDGNGTTAGQGKLRP
jgi:hypothetical protein